MCTCVFYVHAGVHRGQRKTGFPGTSVTVGYELPNMGLGNKLESSGKAGCIKQSRHSRPLCLNCITLINRVAHTSHVMSVITRLSVSASKTPKWANHKKILLKIKLPKDASEKRSFTEKWDSKADVKIQQEEHLPGIHEALGSTPSMVYSWAWWPMPLSVLQR